MAEIGEFFSLLRKKFFWDFLTFTYLPISYPYIFHDLFYKTIIIRDGGRSEHLGWQVITNNSANRRLPQSLIFTQFTWSNSRISAPPSRRKVSPREWSRSSLSSKVIICTSLRCRLLCWKKLKRKISIFQKKAYFAVDISSKVKPSIWTILKVSRSRNKIVEPQLPQKNEQTNLFFYLDNLEIEIQVSSISESSG